MYKDTELRKLPAGYLNTVEEALETDEDWKRFMSLIPKNLEDLAGANYAKKYNGEDIRLIEDHANDTKVKCAKVLFDNWGTSGRVRPTLKTLLDLLVKAEMFKAADAIAIMLGEPLPERPIHGPAAPIDIGITTLLNTDKITLQLESTSVSDHDNKTTKQVKSVNLIEFSESNVNIGEQSGGQTSGTERHDAGDNNNSSLYIPVSNILDPKTNPTHQSVNLPKTESNQTPSSQTPSSQTSASIDDSETIPSHSHVTQTESQTLQTSKFLEQTDKEIIENDRLIQFAFDDLVAITNNFTGTLIGSGGFGKVFLGQHDGLGLLAVKKLHAHLSLETVSKMFNREVKFLSLLNHENIVPILGYSIDGPALCIVCDYINGGSLKQKLAEKVLNKTQRMNIIMGSAEGLRYIHNTVRPKPNNLPTSLNNYLCHRDVKSDNILLTTECIPKLCDFGLAKQFETINLTSAIIGTAYYMAPESIRGTYTVKSDVYSFGMVLLEILTGLEVVVVDSNSSMNISDYIKEHCVNGDITPFVDKVVGDWPEAQRIYDLVKLCLMHEPSDRPSMDEICRKLREM